MIRTFCDRCGIEGDCTKRQIIAIDELGDHVVRGKPLDLCPKCRDDFTRIINESIGSWMSDAVKEKKPLELVKPPPEPDPKVWARLFGLE